MTVAGLIEKLKTMPQDAVALTYDVSYLYDDADPHLSTVWRDDNHGYTSYEENDGRPWVVRVEMQAVVL